MMKTPLRRWIPVALALLAAAPAQAGRLQLAVINGADADQADAPVTAGIPWPIGALRSTDALRLLGPDGKEQPLQAEVLARWPDESIKWTLLDFQATVRRKGSASYGLEYGGGVHRTPSAEPKLAVSEDEAHIAVDCGAAVFTLSRSGFRLFDQVTLSGQEQPLVAASDEADGLTLTSAGQRAFRSSLGPARAEVETRGPMRAVVRVAGKFQAADGARLGDYVARLHFFAGQPAARLELTVLNRGGQPLAADDLSLRLSLRLKGTLRAAFAGDSGQAGAHRGILRGAGDRAELIQGRASAARDARYVVREHERETASGTAAAGSAGLWDDARGAAVAVRGFAASNPKALRLSGGGRIEVGLFPREAGPCKDFLPGRAKTHDLLFRFCSGEPPALEGLAAAFDAPLVACAVAADELRCTGKWVAASGAVAVAPLGASDYDLGFPGDLERLLAAREADGAFGVWNCGGFPGQDFDPACALAREHVRRGEPRLLGTALAAARHLADVGTFHNVEGGNEAWTGACLAATPSPSTGRGGVGAPGEAPPLVAALERSWYAGAWLTGFLTGDRTILAAALENATFVARHADDRDVSPLAAALAILNLCYAADAAPAVAPDLAPAFQAALDAHLNRLLEAQRLGGHGLHDDRSIVGAIALEALAEYQRRRADERVPPSMLRAAEALIRPGAFWSGHEKIGGLHAADGAAVKPYATADGLVADWARHPDAAAVGIPCLPAAAALATIAEATGDTAYLKKARRLERVAALFPCESPSDFALRYRRGDLLAAAWQRVALHAPRSTLDAPRPTPDPAIAFQCRLECAADVALPDIGTGGAVLYRPFVALPDGRGNAYQAQAPGIPDRPGIGLAIPLLDSGNLVEREGTIEFRICYRKGPGSRTATWLVSGDPNTRGFAVSLLPTGLELVSRYEAQDATRVLARGVRPEPGKWHHVAVAWTRLRGADLYFDGRCVGHGSVARLGFGPHLRVPCDPQDQASEYLIDDLRIWKRWLDRFPGPLASSRYPADAVPPAPVRDLLLTPAGDGKALLSWTAPGNDGNQGQALRYDVRTSPRPFGPLSWGGYDATGDPLDRSPARGARVRWAEADRIAPVPKPQAAGQLEKLLIGPFPPGRRVYVALRTEDEANVSALSNVVHTRVNHPPVADAGPPLRQVIVGSTVCFDARDSSDPDYDDLTYQWSNGIQGPTGAVRYDTPGTFDLTLTVSDGAEKARATARIVVGDAVRINFQPRRSTRAPIDFVPDEGLVYSKARGYGWRAIPPGATAFARTQPAGLPMEASTGLAFPEPAEWLLDLPNGAYKLTIGVGDPARLSGQRLFSVEGKVAALVDLDGRQTPPATDCKAEIRDGQLNLGLGVPPEPGKPPAGVAINYILIQRLP